MAKGVLPDAGPGLTPPPAAGRDARGIADALAQGELSALYLLRCDPLDPGDPLAASAAAADGAAAGSPARASEAWTRALESTSTIVAHASHLTAGVLEHASVVFPAESYAQKEGTVTHPDGRLQRVRQAVAHPAMVRPEWQLIAELCSLLGLELELHSPEAASRALFDAVPFYAGISLEEIGGRGVRWQERPQAAAFAPAGEVPG